MKIHSKAGLIRGAIGVVAALVLVPACGGGGGGGSSFSVLSFTPSNGTSGTSRTEVVYIQLSQAANPATVDNTTVLLSNPSGNVPATVTYIACLNQIQVVATSLPLTASTAYTVDVTSGVTNAGGTAINAGQSTFTTGNASDTTRPTFGGPTAAAPAAGTTDSVDVSWSAATDASAVTYEVFVSVTAGCFDFSRPPAASTSTLMATVAGLPSNTTHHFAVRAVDADGNVDADVVNQSFAEQTAKTRVSFAADVHAAILSARCLTCHSPGGIGPFSMVGATTAYNNLVNAVPICSGVPGNFMFRVEPNDSANSFLVNKIGPSPSCGTRMPQDGPPFLTTAQQQTIIDWIDQGADQN